MDLLRFATAGSVDDGKSTLIGRLLLDAKAIFEDQLEAVESTSSVSRIVTDIGGNASSISRSKRSMPAMVLVMPEGRTRTSSPGLSTPPAT
jgi:GTPase